ncbi:hypothetical protein PQI66_03280 [Corynebacterium sp. USCH3]|uniref:hypothetical protein n=1 Tax=Corynebacterium sp. USCH3 TaxID=3024840 RepID=UPI00309E93E7
MNPGDLARQSSTPSVAPGRPGEQGAGAFDAESLVAQVDALLASDADGVDEAALLEDAHHLINTAMEGR